jgi:hypothetical protein
MTDFAESGFTMISNLFDADRFDAIATNVASLGLGAVGSRRLLAHPWCQSLAQELQQHRELSALIPASFVVVQCTYFEKSTTLMMRRSAAGRRRKALSMCKRLSSCYRSSSLSGCISTTAASMMGRCAWCPVRISLVVLMRRSGRRCDRRKRRSYVSAGRVAYW